jgi:hypothetical protein
MNKNEKYSIKNMTILPKITIQLLMANLLLNSKEKYLNSAKYQTVILYLMSAVEMVA